MKAVCASSPMVAIPQNNVIAHAVARAARFRFGESISLAGSVASSGGAIGCEGLETEAWDA
jgi:hypothetical protein